MAKANHETDDKHEPKKGEVADEVHEVTESLRGDLTKLAGSKADKVIGHWQTKLEGMGADTKGIASDLGKLKELVADKSPDGAKISKSLTGLGEKVGKLAEAQGGVVGKALTTLGHQLTRSGESLTK